MTTTIDKSDTSIPSTYKRIHDQKTTLKAAKGRLTTRNSSMSGFAKKFMSSSTNPRERNPDPLHHLRFALETMPGSRKYVFTPATRVEILSELYTAFWGNYAHMFLPGSNSSLPLNATLSEFQASLGYGGAGREESVIPGRPCSHIFKKGESCFRCK